MRESRVHGEAMATAYQIPLWTETLIRPEPDPLAKYLRELWEYSGLMYLLLWRNVKLRYQQTIIGAAWAVLQPLLAMIVLTVLFGRLVKIPTANVPYPVFALSALVPWTYFVHGLTLSAQSLIDHHGLITKVYFPRLILPLVAVLEATIDFFIAFALLAGMTLLYGLTPGWRVWLLPLLFLLLMASVLGAGLWLAALNFKYRDISNALPFVIQLLLFVTPVAYPSSLVPTKWRAVYAINPMCGVMDGFRWALLHSDSISLSLLAISTLAGLGLLGSGLLFFRSREDYFADEG